MAQLEGNDTLNNPLLKWLSQWEFSNVNTLKDSLEKQGIKSTDDFKKYVLNDIAFNKLVSRLNINFVDEINLEKAWKSLQIIDDKKVVFLGDRERDILDQLYRKYDNVSNKINQMQKNINIFQKSIVDAKKNVNDISNKMIEIIQQNCNQIIKQIEAEKIQKEREINYILSKLLTEKKIYSKRKDQFEEIAMKHNNDHLDKRLEKLKLLLIVNKDEYKHNDDEKNENIDIEKVELGAISIRNLNENEFSTNINKLIGFHRNYNETYYAQDNDDIQFSANHGHYDRNNFKITNNGKRVEVTNGSESILCNQGFNKGVHSWSVKLEMNGTQQRRIGITNSLNAKFTGHGCILTEDGISYMWRAGTSCHDIHSCINKKGTSMIREAMDWKNGSIATVKLDCDEWNVQFFHDDQLVGKVNIEKNQTYYPMFHLCNTGSFSIV